MSDGSALTPELSRRQFLLDGGRLLLVGCTMAISACQSASSIPLLTDLPDLPEPDPSSLACLIAMDHTGHVTVFFGKVDVGQGLDTALRQLVADVLQIHPRRIHVVMGDTRLTADQGGASSASGVEMGTLPLMNAAAELRWIMLSYLASRWQCAQDDLVVDDGEIRCTTQASRRTHYHDLIADGVLSRTLSETQLEVSGQGNSLNVRGQLSQEQVIALSRGAWTGTAVARDDIDAKVSGHFQMIDQIERPAMLHARIVRPPFAGAQLVSARLPDSIGGEVMLVQRGAFLAVLAPDEWQAITALWQVQVQWQDPGTVFPGHDQLYQYLRTAEPRFNRTVLNVGDVDSVLLSGVPVTSADYEWPLQSHASLGPACAVAEWKDGRLTVWSATQKPHQLRLGVADLTGLDMALVHVIWVPGAGSYGRNDADDAALDAAFLALERQAAVRVQYQRADATGWDPKSPAAVMSVRASLDSDGKIAAMDWRARALSAHDVRPSGAEASDSLIGQSLGLTRDDYDNFSAPQDAYVLPNRRSQWAIIPPLLRQASPLRTSHLRDPQGPQVTFSSECFIDELAAASSQDPIGFRLRHLEDERDRALLHALRDATNWDTRASPNPAARQPRFPVRFDGAHWRFGRGVAICQRGRQTRVAIVCDVAVDITTGVIRLPRIVVAHDCGRIINPASLRQTIEGAVMQACSRTLFEQVAFDQRSVLSVDWFTYPIMEIDATPDRVDIIMLDRPDQPPLGAGEAAHKPVAAAIANAVFDATGVRLRRIPLRPDFVLAELQRAHL